MPHKTHPQDKKSLLDHLPNVKRRSASLRHIARRKPAEQEKPSTVKTVQELLDKVGDRAEPILYTLLCDPDNPLRKTVDETLRNGTKSAIVALIPLLIAQFALAPAVAVVVAGFIVKTLAGKGQEKLCEELAQARASKKKANRAGSRPKAAVRATKSAARRPTTKSARKE